MIKNTLKTFSLLTFLIMFLSGCYFLPPEEETLEPPLVEPEEISYNTVLVERQDIVKELKGMARFVSELQENAFLEYRGGRIASIEFSLADIVEKGDIL